VFEGSAEVRRVVALAGEEASRFGHRYVGPEHLLLGMLREDRSGAARVLQAEGVDQEAARAALGRLAAQGVVPRPRPSDAELLGTLGIELETVCRDAEQAFGIQRLGWAIREATRARRRGVGRVARTPLEGPPMLAAHALMLAGERAKALGHDAVGSELLLLGVLDDVTTRPPRCMPTGGCGGCTSRWGCPKAIGARSGRCWPPWAWTLTVCVLLQWRRLGRRSPSRRDEPRDAYR
jgi:Clp amino terminal domain, pathogenicity island component